MLTVQSKIILFGLCIIEIIWLLIAQTAGSMLLLLPCLVYFLVLTVWSAFQGMALPMLLFFLPYAALLKFRPGMISLYTVALLIVYVIYSLKGIKSISVGHLVPGLALAAFALIVKTLHGYSIDNGFILFFASIILIPFFKRELGEKYDFYYLTVCFTLGIATAAIAARYLIIFPTIQQYIVRLEYSGLVRYSGFYDDPNFYSAHITAALSGILVLILNSTRGRRLVWLMIMAVLMVYCGSLGVSKSFLVVGVALLLLWLIEFMFQKGKVTAKLTIIMTLLLGTVFLLASTVFTDQVAMLLGRLGQDNSFSDFTTGRTEIWNQYFKAFESSAVGLMFGQGITRDVLANERAAHNTLIQSVFQMGLIGFLFLSAWFVCSIKTLLAGVKIKWQHFTQVGILLIGSIGPWMGLDMLFFDEFFLMPLYVCVGVVFLTQQDEREMTTQSRDLYNA